MKLNIEQMNKALTWINEKCANQRCQMCGTDQWTIQLDVVEVRPFRWGDLAFTSDVYPHLLLTCNHCGQGVLINAIRAGVVSEEDFARRGKELMERDRKQSELLNAQTAKLRELKSQLEKGASHAK